MATVWSLDYFTVQASDVVAHHVTVPDVLDVG